MDGRTATVVLVLASGLLLAIGVPRWAEIPALVVFAATAFWLIHRGDEKAD